MLNMFITDSTISENTLVEVHKTPLCSPPIANGGHFIGYRLPSNREKQVSLKLFQTVGSKTAPSFTL